MQARKQATTLAMAISVALSSSALYAQEDGANMVLEEVLVTAQKREQSLSDVPLAVSAITGEFVRDFTSGGQDIRALAARVPGLNIETSNGRTQPRLYLRGLGNTDFDVNANQPVAMVFDEIYLENNTLRSIPLFDIERIEVLKGPQGSLFGRNTNAGAITITSVRPDMDQNAYFRVGYGSRSTWNLEGATNLAFTEDFTMRASVKHQERDEWIDNTSNGPGDDFGGFEETAWRFQLLWTPNDEFEGLLKFHGFSQEGSDPNVFYANAIEQGTSGVRAEFNEEIASNDDGDLAASLDTDHWGLALNLKFYLDNDVTVTSITGYDSIENFQGADVDGGEISFDPADAGVLGKQLFFGVATGDGLLDHEQWTQEFRFTGGNDRVFWQTGLYYFDEDFTLLNQDFLTPALSALVDQRTKSWAVFGQMEYGLTDDLSVTVGARWTDDKKKLQVRGYEGFTFVSPDSISVDDNFFNWDVALSWDASDDWNYYARLATGSRGPVTLGRFGFVSSARTEDVISAEIGFKSLLADDRVRFNGAIYTFDSDDHQLTATGGIANVNQLLNAEGVKGFGAEAEIDWLVTEYFTLSANVSYTDTEIDDPNLKDDVCGTTPVCTFTDPIAGIRDTPFGPATEVFIDGNPLPRTPEWIANVIFQFAFPVSNGEIYLNNDWNYRDESNLFLYNAVEFVQDSRVLGGLRTGWRNDTWDLALVGRNITDEITVEGGIDFLNLTAFVNEPAFWGVEAVYSF